MNKSQQNITALLHAAWRKVSIIDTSKMEDPTVKPPQPTKGRHETPRIPLTHRHRLRRRRDFVAPGVDNFLTVNINEKADMKVQLYITVNVPDDTGLQIVTSETPVHDLQNYLEKHYAVDPESVGTYELEKFKKAAVLTLGERELTKLGISLEKVTS